jgi:hypothetical protein
MEDIKWHNARELAHIINQYKLDKKYILLISQFLNISREGDDDNYYKQLDKLKKTLEPLAHSSIFLTYLYGLRKPKQIKKSGNIIDNTPNDRIISATYFRILPKSYCYRRDRHIGKPRPNIFIQDHSISGAEVSNIIGHLDKNYTMLNTFGFDFPDTVNIKGMTFKLYDIYDPILTEHKKAIMSSQTYTILYKDYIKRRQNNVAV